MADVSGRPTDHTSGDPEPSSRGDASALPAGSGYGPEESADGRRPIDLLVVRVFLAALSALLAGYMFMGRGFAHVGVAPIYVGEVVLFLGVICTAIAVIRLRLRLPRSRIVWLLLAFMVLGVIRTVPYLGEYGVDALRDAVLWGYAAFALMIFVLVDRPVLLGALRLYGWVVPIFALWLPIAWNIFQLEYASFDPSKLGSFTPLVFFKSGDMAIHATGSIAFLVLGLAAFTTTRGFVGRTIVALPLVWAMFLAATFSRGALLSCMAGLAAAALLGRRTRNWIPLLLATALLPVVLASPGLISGLGQPQPSPTPIASGSPLPSGASPSPGAPSPSPTPLATPQGRTQDINQLVDNFTSVFGESSSGGLEGTKAFRLSWWKAIIDYTVFGPYFWTGKGFGINLADADGFQPTADHSLRAPHNSHISVLARMGVPSFVLWILIQGAFGIALLRSALAHRRADDGRIAALGGLVLVYWAAMMVDTSFDPYLEGPQGGIWFWVLFGLGLVVIRLTPRRGAT